MKLDAAYAEYLRRAQGVKGTPVTFEEWKKWHGYSDDNEGHRPQAQEGK